MKIVKNKDFKKDESVKRHDNPDSPLRWPMHSQWAETHEERIAWLYYENSFIAGEYISAKLLYALGKIRLQEKQNEEFKNTVEKSLSGLLEPDVKETVLGSAEIQKIFKVSNAGKIAGSKVINGEIKSKSKARIIRDGVVVYSGEIQSIFREKNQVKEVGTGFECGISIKDFIDFKEKDVIESYQAEKIQRSI